MDNEHHQTSPWLMAIAATPVTAGSVDLLHVDLLMLYLTIATSLIVGVLAGCSWRGARVFGLLGARSPAIFGFHRVGTVLLSMALAVPALRGAWDLIKRFSSPNEIAERGGSSCACSSASASASASSHSLRNDVKRNVSTRVTSLRRRLSHKYAHDNHNSNDDGQGGECGGGRSEEQVSGLGCGVREVTRRQYDVEGGEVADLFLSQQDLQKFKSVLEDEDPAWESMTTNATAKLTFAAWRREVPPGPTQYKSSTIFESCTPELVANFFWDDSFRKHWDDMLVKHRRVEGVNNEGSEIVHWVRRFPFFCSPRDYVITRRIWSSGNTFYCVTKGIDHPAAPRQVKPRRVDVYYSSWRIRAVPSPRGNSAPAVEVTLFHCEDMGIQRDIAKFGVKKGMWSCVKKMDPGILYYEQQLRSQAVQDRHRFICTRIEDGAMASISALEGGRVVSMSGSSSDGGGGGSTHVGLGLELAPRGVRRAAVKKGMKMALIAGGVVLACGVNHATVYKLVGMGLAKALLKKRMEKQEGMGSRSAGTPM